MRADAIAKSFFTEVIFEHRQNAATFEVRNTVEGTADIIIVVTS